MRRRRRPRPICLGSQFIAFQLDGILQPHELMPSRFQDSTAKSHVFGGFSCLSSSRAIRTAPNLFFFSLPPLLKSHVVSGAWGRGGCSRLQTSMYPWGHRNVTSISAAEDDRVLGVAYLQGQRKEALPETKACLNCPGLLEAGLDVSRKRSCFYMPRGTRRSEPQAAKRNSLSAC